jgi:hypothetical protein
MMHADRTPKTEFVKGPARDDQLERVTQFTRDLVRGNRGEMQ